MQFKEFGTDNRDALVLIHGLGITWRMFLPIIDKLQSRYHLILPILDGHNEEDDSVFKTIEIQADKIINYLKNNYGNTICGIYGVSLGGAITACILEKNAIAFKYAIIDAGPVYPINKCILKLSVMVKTNQVMSLKGSDSRYRKLMEKTFYPSDIINEVCKLAQSVKKETLVNSYNSAFHYKLAKLNYSGKLAYWYGTKEAFLCKKYAKHIKTIYPDTTVTVFTNFDHGQLAIGNPQKCAEKIEEFLN